MGIKIRDLEFKYDDELVLKDVNLEIKKQEITALIGPNGSGKTTLLENICGLLKAKKGEIKINKNQKLGISFQFPEEQFFQPTVYKEILFGMKSFKYKTKNKKKRAIDALTMVGLNITYLNKNPFELSEGEKRRVSIAAILAYNPQYIILDEPTIGLDDKGKKHLLKLLLKLKKQYKKTIIIVSHDIDFLYAFADRFVVLKKGKLLTDFYKKDYLKKIDILKKEKIDIPKIISFVDLVKEEKKIKLGYQQDIKELMKAVYRSAE